MNSYDIIVKPILSEKSFDGIPNKNYTFVVNKAATKTDIKKAVEEVFSVTVERVNTVNYDGKIKKMGKNEGRRPAYKKAFVKLTAESKAIEFFESLA